MTITIHNVVHGNAEVTSYNPADVAGAVLVVCGGHYKNVDGGVTGATVDGSTIFVAGVAKNDSASQVTAGIFYLPSPGTSAVDVSILRGNTSGSRPCFTILTLGGVDVDALGGGVPFATAVSNPGDSGTELTTALTGLAEDSKTLSFYVQFDDDEDPQPMDGQQVLAADRVYTMDYRVGAADVGAGGDAQQGWSPIRVARAAMAMTAFPVAAAPPADQINVANETATGTIVRSDPVTRRGTVALAGSYVGNPPAIEYRLVDDDDGNGGPGGAALAGHDWQVLVAAPTGGTFSANVSNVPEGGGRAIAGTYRAEVRFSNDISVTGTTGGFGVGPVLALAGQSNMQRWTGTYGDPPALTVLGGLKQNGSASAADPVVGNGAIAFVNAFTKATGMPLTLMPRAVAGTAISAWNGDDPADPAPNYNQLRVFGGNAGIIGVLWNQGEADDELGGPAYRTALANLGRNLRRDLGRADVRLIAVPVLYPSNAGKDKSGLRAVRQAQYEFIADDPQNFVTAHSPDLTANMIDGLHLDGPGYAVMGTRAGLAVANILGGAGVVDAGPEIAATSRISTTQTDVTFAHAAGSALSPAGGATGFGVSVDGFASVLAISDVTVTDGDTVRLTHAAAGAGVRSVRYMAGAPDPNAALVDDAGFAAEPEYVGVSEAAVPVAAIAPASLRMSIATRGARVAARGTGLPRSRTGRVLRPERDRRTLRIFGS
ncbi:hypothetical protein KCG44_00280 [Pacificimonas sp. WHA3]|uniref:Sialate O-acetylesterase domain-containing protein n=1 Tax=Pacificimonas pallii TaxID=2827236 RepID=A0ABS6SBA7_9SPHN|nr:sialate O-acetylesterase [Pacificimonas pallii]MBV7255211.1 hypothetical protein [Pacificimonas pallii]